MIIVHHHEFSDKESACAGLLSQGRQCHHVTSMLEFSRNRMIFHAKNEWRVRSTLKPAFLLDYNQVRATKQIVTHNPKAGSERDALLVIRLILLGLLKPSDERLRSSADLLVGCGLDILLAALCAPLGDDLLLS